MTEDAGVCSQAEAAHPGTPRRGRQPTRRKRHAYTPYPDSETGLAGYCQRCNLQGQAGDTRHLTSEEVEARRRYEQRMLGEGDE